MVRARDLGVWLGSAYLEKSITGRCVEVRWQTTRDQLREKVYVLAKPCRGLRMPVLARGNPEWDVAKPELGVVVEGHACGAGHVVDCWAC